MANKSGVEKEKKFCIEQWIFLVNFRTVPTKCFWRNWENSFQECEFEKNMLPKWKNVTKFTNCKIERKRKRKHWYRGICVCNLNKLWKNKGDFKGGSKVQGPMNLSKVIGQKL
jgi:hypothetical protein